MKSNHNSQCRPIAAFPEMLRTLAAVVVLAVACFATLSVSQLAAEEGFSSPSNSRVLLLRNGQAIVGQVSYEGEYYRVVLPTGEIRIRAAEVEHLCRDLQDAYRVKWAAISPNDVDAQMRLADWCVEYKMFEQAEALIVVAEQASPEMARVRIARRNLQLALNPQRSPPSVPAMRVAPLSNRGDLDALTKSMPHGTVETFRKTIQPMLVAGCAAARCHGTVATNEFRLIRPVRGHILSRRATQRNLQAVLTWLNSDKASQGAAGETPILTRMMTAHGGEAKSVALSVDSPQYQVMVNWVADVTRPAVSPLPTSSGQRGAALSQTLESADGRQVGAVPRPTSAANDEDKSRASGQEDAWDPGIFNDRHHETPPAE